MFSGLSAFPLTPMNEQGIDDAAFVPLVQRLADAGVDSIGALGSTGSYAYLTREERSRVARLAVANAGGVPVIVGIGALRTREVLALAEDAQQAGASAVLLAPVSYQKLSSDEVYGLYKAVAHELSVPLCVYDNPGTGSVPQVPRQPARDRRGRRAAGAGGGAQPAAAAQGHRRAGPRAPGGHHPRAGAGLNGPGRAPCFALG